MFFEYERGQKLGLWVLAVDSGLLLGPTCKILTHILSLSPQRLTDPVGGFLNLVSAAWINWFNAILFAVLLILELFFLPETLYPRQQMLLSIGIMTQSGPSESEKTIAAGIQPPPLELASADADLLRTTALPFITIHPIPGMRHPKPWDALTRFCLTFQLPVIVIAVIGFSFTWYWWILSIITMEPAAYPEYTPLIQGLLFLGLFLGTIVSEVCCSGRLSDYIMMRLTKDNGNARVPEMRLWLSYPAIVITAGMCIKSIT